ncbi:helix-turn-helix transcriptional regulator [Bosea sp. TND4EK4]|uniref:helix-turn-helix domain-containing protein n=1 Tax=Bosea sp. (in: a-proteobacteria) TaxID=1871050 RepID=UPI000970E14B|nr:MAG: LuxR family transcriptional regulator [Bosea sp. (in: a-proteobacteria)]
MDLTPGEARVTRVLTSGQSAADIARACGVSVETVRSQIRSILQKLGMHRQAELVGFLAGLIHSSVKADLRFTAHDQCPVVARAGS